MNTKLDIYKNITQSYSDTQIIKCSQLIVYNEITLIVEYGLITLDNNLVYTSGNYVKWQTLILDLSSINLLPGFQFKLKVMPKGAASDTSNVILEYQPNSSAVYFQSLNPNGTNLQYIDTVPCPNSIPTLQASVIIAHNQVMLSNHWAFLDLNNNKIYESGRCGRSDSTKILLNNLGMPTGTKFKFKALATGADSIAYIILEYSPTSETIAYFELRGMVEKSMLKYRGRTNPF